MSKRDLRPLAQVNAGLSRRRHQLHARASAHVGGGPPSQQEAGLRENWRPLPAQEGSGGQSGGRRWTV